MEKLVAYHCGPALAGIKPANIVTCYKDKISDIHSEIKRLNAQLNKKDIFLEILCECDRRALVIVYRSRKLTEYLHKNDIAHFLSSHGYPENGDICANLSILKSRLLNGSFPHEIGAFLGYPLHDILGFINSKDEGCLLCGEWKVYKNAEDAKKLFARFFACRQAILKRIDGGKSLAQLFCAA